MKSHQSDMVYQLDLFQRIQNALVNGIPLVDVTIHQDAVLWQRFNQTILWTDIKRFATGRSYEAFCSGEAALRKYRVKSLVFFTILAIFTFFGALAVILGKHKVLIFSIDKVSDSETLSDFRLHALYQTLKKNHISFVECFHTLLNKQLLLNIVKRKRMALYLEAFDGLWYAYRFLFRRIAQTKRLEITRLAGSEDEIQFMKTTIKKYLALKGLLEFRVAMLKTILRLSAVKIVLGIDDTRHYHELMEACRELGIRTTVVQHGHFTKYHVGWLGSEAYGNLRYQRADKLFVWSEYWKQELLRLGSVYPEQDIVVAGYQRPLTKQKFAEKQPGTTLLVPYETDSPKDEVATYLKILASCPHTKVYFKIRPDVSEKDQVSESIAPFVTVVSDIHAVPEPDAVLGVYSTFLYDMAAIGVPVLMMKTSMDYGEGMIKNDMTNLLPREGVCNHLPYVLAEATQKAEERKRRLEADVSFEQTLAAFLKEAGVL